MDQSDVGIFSQLRLMTSAFFKLTSNQLPQLLAVMAYRSFPMCQSRGRAQFFAMESSHGPFPEASRSCLLKQIVIGQKVIHPLQPKLLLRRKLTVLPKN